MTITEVTPEEHEHDEIPKHPHARSWAARIIIVFLCLLGFWAIWQNDHQRVAAEAETTTAQQDVRALTSTAEEANARLKAAGKPTVTIPEPSSSPIGQPTVTVTAPAPEPSYAQSIVPSPGPIGSPGPSGSPGASGAPGRAPTAQEIAQALAAYCAGPTKPCTGKDGKDGSDGKDGKDGADSGEVRSILRTYCADAGLTIEYSDGTADVAGPCGDQTNGLPTGLVRNLACQGPNLVFMDVRDVRHVLFGVCAASATEEPTPTEEPS